MLNLSVYIFLDITCAVTSYIWILVKFDLKSNCGALFHFSYVVLALLQVAEWNATLDLCKWTIFFNFPSFLNLLISLQEKCVNAALTNITYMIQFEAIFVLFLKIIVHLQRLTKHAHSCA